jgi:uncharacterized C2H2 Zn-finger protein
MRRLRISARRERPGRVLIKICSRCGYVFWTDATASNCACGGVLKTMKRRW